MPIAETLTAAGATLAGALLGLVGLLRAERTKAAATLATKDREHAAALHAAREARQAAADAVEATGRHATHTAEVAMVPQLLARIAALEAGRETDRAQCAADLAEMRARADAADRRAAEEQRLRIAQGTRLDEVLRQLDELRRRGSLPPGPSGAD